MAPHRKPELGQIWDVTFGGYTGRRFIDLVSSTGLRLRKFADLKDTLELSRGLWEAMVEHGEAVRVEPDAPEPTPVTLSDVSAKLKLLAAARGVLVAKRVLSQYGNVDYLKQLKRECYRKVYDALVAALEEYAREADNDNDDAPEPTPEDERLVGLPTYEQLKAMLVTVKQARGQKKVSELLDRIGNAAQLALVPASRWKALYAEAKQVVAEWLAERLAENPPGHYSSEAALADLYPSRDDAPEEKPLPYVGMQEPPVPASGIVDAHIAVAISDIGACLLDTGMILRQGRYEGNAAKRGGIAVGLRRAAWRIQHGKLDGFDESLAKEARPEVDLEPYKAMLLEARNCLSARPDSSLTDRVKALASNATPQGDIWHMLHEVIAVLDADYGEEIAKIDKLLTPPKSKTMGD